MLNGQSVRRLPTPHLPLRRLMMCLDCEECFEIGASACPSCGGETWIPLARLLDSRGLRPPRAQSGSGYMVVVAPDQPVIYRQLVQMFAGDDKFEVITDRRRGDRRRSTGLTAKERRTADRRVHKPHAGLRVFGWIIAKKGAGK